MNFDETRQIPKIKDDSKNTKKVIYEVFDALKEKGYNPVNQLVGYILSGDPSYITSYNDARVLISTLERDEILEELIKTYLNIDKKQ